MVSSLEKPGVREFFYVGALSGLAWECQNVTLKCEIGFDGSADLRMLHYTLYRNGVLVMKQSDSGEFRIPRIGLGHGGTYACAPETRLGLGGNKTLRLNVKGKRIDIRGGRGVGGGRNDELYKMSVFKRL